MREDRRDDGDIEALVRKRQAIAMRQNFPFRIAVNHAHIGVLKTEVGAAVGDFFRRPVDAWRGDIDSFVAAGAIENASDGHGRAAPAAADFEYV